MFKTKEEHLEHFRQVARTEWFKNHQVETQDFTNGDKVIRAVRFRRPGTIIYSVKYVFDGCRIYVSGDLGCAVFECTWTPKPDDKTPSFWYFFEKCRAYEGDRWDFNTEVCKATLRNTLLMPDKNGNHTVYPETWDNEAKRVFRALLRGSEETSTPAQWSHVMQEVSAEEGSLSSVDNDYWEWMYGAGNVMPTRMIGMLTGLRMVSEHLSAKEVISPYELSIDPN